MNRCIICNEENLQPSDEHILPDSLGGKIIINSVCKKCNSILGETVDSWILNDDLLVVIRDRLKIKKEIMLTYQNILVKKCLTMKQTLKQY